nr:Fe2OG oxygenase [Mimivirus sp.]
MSKNFKIKRAKNLNGFSIIYDYISLDQERKLLNQINKSEWVVDYQRRLQYYNYRNELFEPYDLIPIPNKIPKYLNRLIDQMISDKIIDQKPDQIIINEYKPGEGLKPHFDRKDYYQNVIIGISLGSGTIMEFYKNKPEPEKKNICTTEIFIYIKR